ncbi:MAG: HPP family protein [Gammaproteobacteria bacterium]|nr:HPP family protein [Gammaproteobacteria bacterium]MCW8911068.1 HPP family protein [Gammaproteobacteria bacterium]MCW9004741.1 HPP family protein [Gammaproteobacteria bacterium]MCW9056130.1 HPP family protein [Gammaproteobacteria bacterium]
MKQIINLLGIQGATSGHAEKIISAIGGFLGIGCIFLVTSQFVQGLSAALIVASMGASAVLLFAVPNGPLSQPWPVMCGHVVSALIGISCYKLIPDLYLAAAIAVGLSIGGMHYLRCIHPPGGASALAAVVGGADVHALGYNFVFTPVLINVLVILTVAVLVNYPFAWRRYPVSLCYKEEELEEGDCRYRTKSVIPRSDLKYALESIGSFADVTEEELEAIYRIASKHNQQTRLTSEDIRPGCYYSHGRLGDDFIVRMIIDESRNDNAEKDMVIYKTIKGNGQGTTACITRQSFAQWAKFEVINQGDVWKVKEKNED